MALPPLPSPSHNARRSSSQRPATATGSGSGSGSGTGHSSKLRRDSHVISSLIASLDADSSVTYGSHSSYIPSLNNIDKHDKFRLHSFDHAARPSLKHSQSFGMDYGAYRSSSRDQDYDSEGAEFPIIPTSRRPASKSTHTAPPSPQLHGLKDLLRSASKTTLSFAPTGQERPSRPSSRVSRVSTESWRTKTQPSPRKLSLDTVSDKLIRRLSLSQTRDASTPVGDHQQSAADEALLSPALTAGNKELQRLAYSSKGRLYLEDVHEQLDASSSIAPDPSQISSSSTRATDSKRSLVKSNSGSRIADAIVPLRSSSLNKIHGVAKTKTKKSSKGKRPLSTLKEEKAQLAKSRMDSSKDMFEGLDEQDHTVMRIRELRQRKQDRLRKESEALSGALNGPRHVHDSIPPAVTTNGDQPKLPAIRASARSPNLGKAHRMLGLDSTSNHTSVVNQTDTATASNSPSTVYQNDPSATSDFRKRNVSTVDSANLSSPSSIPGAGDAVAATSTRPFRTSAAYASGEAPYDSSSIGRLRAVARTSTSSPLLNGLDIEGIDLSPPGTAHPQPVAPARTSSSRARKLSYDTRTRRKSMSDARQDRLSEDAVLREWDNSVSTAVDIFLSKPRLNQKVRHARTHRIISFSEVGDPDGFAVIVCVGMGLTRFVSVFYDELATSLGLRLITPERPGVGASEPLRERDNIGPLGWTDDVLTITQHLGISQFSLIAHSAGAIYALATALILPQNVRGSVQLLAPWIPPSQFENIRTKDQSPDSIPVAALTRGQRFLRVLPVPFLRAANGNFFSASSIKPANSRNNGNGSPGTNGPRGSPKRRNSSKRPDPVRRESMMLMDQVIPEKPRDTMFPLPELWEDEKTGIERVRKPSLELSATASPLDPAFALAADALLAAEHSAREHQAAYSSLLTERTWTLATRDSNPAVDLIVCLERHRDVGFRYVDVQRKVVITHGTEDKRVPLENIRWIGDQMNRNSLLQMAVEEKGINSGESGCEIRVLPGEGHGLMAQPGVMSDILSDIAKEWSATKC